MSEQVLVIVESPTKAKTIKKFLPKGYTVLASMGHVRDLPQTASEIPAKYKATPYAKYGVDVTNNFDPLYVIPKGKKKVITELKQALKGADRLFLATDEDREGESISWHLMELLKPKCPVRRMVFHEITKSAIQHAIEHGRDLDVEVVHAQEARRILDRLYGYTLSPLLWKKVGAGLSAGRVQSPGLRLIVERERERIRFVRGSYWDLSAELTAPTHDKSFTSKLVSYQGKKLATGKSFDPSTGKLKSNSSVLLLDEKGANSLKKELESASWKVATVEEKETVSRPALPFITSSLQQEGNRKLKMSARETMRVAQSLYEKGFITYMRTDSPALSQEGVSAARKQVEELYGSEYLSAKPRNFSAKKGAQEAHEAIRPAGGTPPEPKHTGLAGKELQLYSLIWKRTLASQMAEAKKAVTSVKIQAGDAIFTVSGIRIIFPGFIKVYVEGLDDPEEALMDKESWLPELKEGMELALQHLKPLGHETKPPARYTEATLIKELEQRQIGRPSTYASIVNTLYDRGYATGLHGAMVPSFTGFGVVQFLEENFHYLIEYDFTKEMEQSLDEIAEGSIEHVEYLRTFFLGDMGLETYAQAREEKIDPAVSKSIKLPQLTKTEIRIGRYGVYGIRKDGDKETKITIPENTLPADISEEQLDEFVGSQEKEDTPIGTDPNTGLPVFLLLGRFGPYVQLGEVSDTNKKPKRASLPKGVAIGDVTIESALTYLSLPRELGTNPESGNMISASVGRFGPYVVENGDFRSLKKDDDVYTITLDRALEILKEPKKGKAKSSQGIKSLGKTKKGDDITLMDGRYGPYLKVGKKNVKLPKEIVEKGDLEKLELKDIEQLLP